MKPHPVVHLTLRAYRLPVLLTGHALASWLWGRLRHAFPAALAAVIMPNHLHLVTAALDPAEARRRLASIINGLRRTRGQAAAIDWEPIRASRPIPDVKQLRRLVRYVALNPCRAGLVDDPLRWPWSTHRDVIGAIASPWIDAPRLASALRAPAGGFASTYHGYVSAEPCVNVAGTIAPRRAAPTGVAVQPLEALAASAAAASRGTPEAIGRRSATRAFFLKLAGRHGWRDAPQLAGLCQVSRRSVYWNRGRSAGRNGGLSAAELCLGDERLRCWAVPGPTHASPNCANEETHSGMAGPSPLELP